MKQKNTLSPQQLKTKKQNKTKINKLLTLLLKKTNKQNTKPI